MKSFIILEADSTCSPKADYSGSEMMNLARKKAAVAEAEVVVDEAVEGVAVVAEAEVVHQEETSAEVRRRKARVRAKVKVTLKDSDLRWLTTTQSLISQ